MGQVGSISSLLPPSPTFNGKQQTSSSSPSSSTLNGKQQLSSTDQEAVRQLKQRDEKVRAHEEAHVAAGGGYVRGGPNYTYERGPDGQMYAVGGDVQIDVAPEKNPRQTIQKMEVVRAAALAPANPSSQDRAVAAEASAQEAQAEAQVQSQAIAQLQGKQGGQTGTQIDVFA